MKAISKTALRLMSSACLLTLAACGGGGGGGTTLGTTPNNTTTANNTTSNNTTSGNTTSGDTTSGNTTSGNTTSGNTTSGNTTSGNTTSGNTTSSSTTSNNTSSGNTSANNTTSTTTTPTLSIGAPSNPSVALQTQPVFNLVNNPPPVGTVMGVVGPAVKATSTTVSAQDIGNAAQTVYRGTVTSNGTVYPVFDLTIPAISLSATNLHGDGTFVTLPDGSQAANIIASLTYTILGAWTYIPATGGTTYLGSYATGSATPAASVPTIGSAVYNGHVAGFYFAPSSTGTMDSGAVGGNLSITTNFATNAVTGSMTGMTSTSGTTGATAMPWNDVSLSGTIPRLSPTVQSFNGTTHAAAPPAGAGTAAFSSAAAGNFAGGFFGPNADEVGGTWTLTDSTAAGGGKTALGVFGGAK